MTSRLARLGAVGLVLWTWASARGQGPTFDPGPLQPLPGSGGSMLGPSPGNDIGDFANPPGAGQGTLGGRAGPGASRAPASVTRPSGPSATARNRGIPAPEALEAARTPAGGSLDFPNVIDDLGPADGITLDAAIERLVRENLYLRAAAFEIPQAEADLLTASLRANPVFYADSQLIPYGRYSPERPGGETQYDVNISYPLDVSGKRRARIASASRAKLVLEQQYRDAVRLQIGNLHTLFVDVLAARAALRFAEAGVEGLDTILVPVGNQFRQGAIIEADYLKVVLQREAAEIGRRDAELQLRKTRRGLANALNIPPEQADGLDVRGPLRDDAPPAPDGDDLIRLAMESRPDLAAYRLGVCRAEADVKLALANRYQDIYVLYQPYTFQDNEPLGAKSATSWALGVTVPIPIYNRNQGNILRARLAVGQTQTQLAGQIRQVVTDVEEARQEYLITGGSAGRFETTLRPYATKILATARQRLDKGDINMIEFLSVRGDHVAIVRQYLDVLVRHRRAMLDLNTAVGRRVLP